jgi:hypothetical protein
MPFDSEMAFTPPRTNPVRLQKTQQRILSIAEPLKPNAPRRNTRFKFPAPHAVQLRRRAARTPSFYLAAPLAIHLS